MLSDEYLLRLHEEMFGDVWKWAGKFRERDTNIGVPSHLIRTSLRDLYAEVRGWLEYPAYPPNEIEIRLTYRVVTIHSFPNGNGRHARMLAHIVMARHFGLEPLPWGGSALSDADYRRSRSRGPSQSCATPCIRPLRRIMTLEFWQRFELNWDAEVSGTLQSADWVSKASVGLTNADRR